MSKTIYFKRGESATLDDLGLLLIALPTGVRKLNLRYNGVSVINPSMIDDLSTEEYFTEDCKVTIEIKRKQLNTAQTKDD